MHGKEVEEKLKCFLEEKEGKIAYCFMDLAKGETVSYQEDASFYAASTIKVFIMGALFAAVESGQAALADTIRLSAEDRVPGDGVLQHFDEKKNFTVLELCKLMIVISDNEAANLLMDYLGIETVNQYIASLGISDIRLYRKYYDFNECPSNPMTAKAYATFFRKLYFHEAGTKEACKQMLDILLAQQVKGRLDLHFPPGVKIAHKTGDVDYLEHDGGIIYTDRGNYVLVVLTENMPTNGEGRLGIGEISRLFYKAYTE